LSAASSSMQPRLYGPSPPQPPPSPAAIPPWYPQAAPQPATTQANATSNHSATSRQRGKSGSPAMMIMQPLPQLEATLRPRTAHERTHTHINTKRRSGSDLQAVLRTDRPAVPAWACRSGGAPQSCKQARMPISTTVSTAATTQLDRTHSARRENILRS
jgi:hypothetical protein